MCNKTMQTCKNIVLTVSANDANCN